MPERVAMWMPFRDLPGGKAAFLCQKRSVGAVGGIPAYRQASLPSSQNQEESEPNPKEVSWTTPVFNPSPTVLAKPA